jgi:ubiquinone/menaquinone biosynthesis C-methylase UbiE
MATQFAGMKYIDYDDGLYERYATGRGLGPDVLRMWMDAVVKLVDGNEVRRIIDLGAGTGRFSSHLATSLKAIVIAVDPSRKMLRDVSGSVRRVLAKAERLPFADDSVDLVFASMVLHHIGNLDAAAAEVRRILCPAGVLLVRACFSESLDPPYHRFFTSLPDLERSLLPSTSEVVESFARWGLGLTSRQTLKQRMNHSLNAYAERIRQRAMSPLTMISDAEFEEGMRKLDQLAHDEAVPAPVFENIDLLRFSADVA